MPDTLYAFRTGDDVCTPFRTDDPVIAAGLYADENGAGQVFVVVGDRIEECDVSATECDDPCGCDWFVDRVGSHRAPVGWLLARGKYRSEYVSALGGAGALVSTSPGRRIEYSPPKSRFGYELTNLRDVEDRLCRRKSDDWVDAATEAVLRMAAHVAWGGREGGEVRP